MAVWSEVKYSRTTQSSRLDAEYWKLEYLRLEESLEQAKCVRLGDLVDFVRCGPFGSNLLCETYIPDGVIVLRPFNIKCMSLERENLVSISRDDCLKQGLHFYRHGDVAFSRVGDVRVGIIPDYGKDVTISPNIIVARPKSKLINPFYLTAFMNSSLGLKQLERALKVVAQPTISIDIVKNLSIPLIEKRRQEQVQKKLENAFIKQAASERLYSEASGLLLEELGLGDLDLSPNLFYEREFSETQQAARLDSEFFQPKYQRVLKALENNRPKRIALLEEFLDLLTNGHTPRHHDLSEGDVPFLTAEHVFDFRINYDSEKRILSEHHNDELKRTRLRKGDCLITIKGRIGNAAVAEDFTGPININQDVGLFRLKDGLPLYYLLAYLNSQAGQAFTRQYCTGQINPFLGLGNIRRLPVPIYDDRCMQQIASKTEETVLKARAARDESRRLLEEAKRMVDAIFLERG